jgi:hypothetical protein
MTSEAGSDDVPIAFDLGVRRNGPSSFEGRGKPVVTRRTLALQHTSRSEKRWHHTDGCKHLVLFDCLVYETDRLSVILVEGLAALKDDGIEIGGFYIAHQYV